METASTAAEVVQRFEAVVNGLNDDLSRLSELSAVRACLQAPDGGENANPNAAGPAPPTKGLRESTVERLKEIEALVTSLESRAEDLQGVVESEEAASEELRKIRDEALAQGAEMREMEENLPSKLPGDAGADVPLVVGAGAVVDADDNASLASASLASVSVAMSSQLGGRDVYPALQPIAEAEFNAIGKTVRGRLTLTSLNDAIKDINDVGSAKFRALRTGGKTSKKFQTVIVKHRETKCDDHEGRFFVSEPDLRDNCAFFRAGESTAKGLLNLLRGMKRLKQVQGNGNVVTYAFV